MPKHDTISGHPLGSETDNDYHRMTGAQMPKNAYRRFDPIDREPVHVGIDYGHGPDKTFVTEFTRDPDGTIHVHSVSECNGEDCGTQYTGGQDF